MKLSRLALKREVRVLTAERDAARAVAAHHERVAEAQALRIEQLKRDALLLGLMARDREMAADFIDDAHEIRRLEETGG